MMNLNVLFWNVGGNEQIGGLIGKLVCERSIDIVCLAENAIAPETLLQDLATPAMRSSIRIPTHRKSMCFVVREIWIWRKFMRTLAGD